MSWWQWVFSGIGVALPLALIGWLLKNRLGDGHARKTVKATSRRSSGLIQTAGDNATQQVITGDYIAKQTVGPDVSDLATMLRQELKDHVESLEAAITARLKRDLGLLPDLAVESRRSAHESGSQPPEGVVLVLNHGSPCVRIHPEDTDPVAPIPAAITRDRFGPGGGETYSGLYFATSCRSGLLEAMGRFVPSPHLTAFVRTEWEERGWLGPGALPLDWLRRRRYSVVSPRRDLRLYDLAAPGAAAALGLESSDLQGQSTSGRAVRAIAGRLPHVDGISWANRYVPEERLMMVFSDRLCDGDFAVEATMPIDQAPCWLSVLRELGLEQVEPPSS